MNNQDLLNQGAFSSFTIEELEALKKKALEGKQNVPEGQTPPTGQNQEAAAGDSSLADTSLGSPLTIDYGPDEFAQQTGVVAEKDFEVSGINEMPKSYLVEQGDYGTRNKIEKENRKKRLEHNQKYNVRTAGLTGIGEFSASRIPVFEDIEPTKQESFNIEIEENDLELESTKSNMYFNGDKDNSFVNQYYNVTDLEKIGVDIDDFQGYLNANQFSKDFEQDLLRGVYTSNRIDGTKLENQKTLNIARERVLALHLNNYIEETNEKANKKAFLESYNLDPSVYDSEANFDEAYIKYLEAEGTKTLYNQAESEKYVTNNLNFLANRAKEIQLKRYNELQKQLDQGNTEGALDAIVTGSAKFVDAFPKAFIDLSIMAQDIIGMDATAKTRRAELYEKEQLDTRGYGSYVYASGKSLTINGKKYLKDEKGTIYDVDAGVSINEIMDPFKLKGISDKIDREGVKDSDISAAGLTIQGGAVVGDVIAQMIGTKGLGAARKAASLQYLAKAKGFKDAASVVKFSKMGAKGGKGAMSNIGTFGKKLPFNAAMLDATMFQSLYGAVNGYEGTIRAAKQAGFSDEEAQSLANQAALQMSILYAATGPINPRIPGMNKLDDLISQSKVFNKALKNYRASGNVKDFSNTITKFAKDVAKGTPAALKTIASEGAKETVQENIQQAGELLLVNRNLNEIAGEDFLNASYSKDDIVTTSILSFAVGGLVGGKLPGVQSSEYQRLQNLFVISKDLEGAKKRFDFMIDKGKMSADERDGILEQAGAISAQSDKIPTWMLGQNNHQEFIDAAVTLNKIKKLQDQKSKTDKAFHEPIDLQIEEEQKNLEGIINQALEQKKQAVETAVKKDIETVENIVGKENVTVFNTKKEMEDAGFDEGALTSDGFMETDGKIIINLEVAVNTQAISVASHELLHRVLRSELATLPEGTKERITNELRNLLPKEALELIESKLKTGIEQGFYDIKFDEDGKVSGNDIDEYMNFLFVALNEKEVIIKENVLIELGRWIVNQIRAFRGIDKKFENGQQVLDFVKDYQKSITKGRLSAAARIKAKQSEGIKGSKTKKSVTNKKQLFETIESVVPKKAKTKAEFQADPGFTDIYMLLQPGQPVHNFIVSKFPGQTEKVRGLIESLEERLINFDPEKKRKGSNETIGTEGFVEFLMANINFAALDINKKLAKEAAREKQTGSLDSETAKQVADISNEIKKELSKRPEYRDLLRRKVVDEDVVKDIEQKVIRIVALLKSRIDAKVSNNVTVAPLIKEIKNQAGKSIDIDFKKAMGGKKDGELRKFLLRNKAAILENMSTTWLSQAIPNAIQKSVDGVFTTDWKGKKIDRETMETDLAGRTSGADLVRRLPKAPGAISDSDFLSLFLEPNGNPTRGKKESLAKAMAEEITFDIIKKSFDENGPIAQALIENQKRNGVENAENMGPEFKRQAERGNIKFSISPPAVNVLNEADIMATLQLLDSADGDSRVLKQELIQTALTKILKDNGYGNKLFDLSNSEQLETYTQTIKEFLVPIMEKDFWGTNEATHLLHSKEIMFGGKTDKKLEFEAARSKLIEDIFNDSDQKYGKKIAKPKKFKNPKTGRTIDTTPTNVFQNEEIARAAYEAGAVLSYNVWAEQTGKQLWFGLKDVLQQNKDNPNVAIAIATWLSSSASNTKHPMRALASMIGYSKGFDKKVAPIEIEHALPATTMIQTLFNTALQNPEDFATNYSYVSKNYVLIGMNKSDELKTKKFAKKSIKEYNLRSGTWWDRYLNPVIAKEQGYLRGDDGKKQFFDGDFGIDPKSIILFSGKSLYEVAGVKKNGSFETNIQIEVPTIGLKGGKQKYSLRDLKKIAAKDKVRQDRFENGQRKYSASFAPPEVLNAQFNAILSRKSGIDGATEISRARGQILGRGKGRFKFFIAPGADDFRGLVHYAFAGKGKQGEKDMEFFEKNLMDPYFRGIAAIDAMRQLIKREFKVVTTEFKDEYKMLKEPVPGTPFTYDQALRVYMWGLAGIEVPGLDKRDLNTLENAILDNPALADFAEALLIVGRREAWPKPSEFWLGDSVLADLNSMTEKVGRKDILAQFITNVDAMFDEATLNKIEAIKGRKHREALEDSIYAMKNGSNRPSGANMQTNKWLNWINGSTASIMFFNRRSALLQMLSFTNFINWSDNNPIKAAAAFANQTQYWKDFVFLFNSDKLKERRGGLKQDISESEIAQVAGKSKNSPQAVLARILKAGFLPTQIADSFAIATGGATFYRNRVNTYLKQGMSQKKAEEKAFEDFSKASDVAQQSSDPALVSQEQRSILGRLILAFANTPMQYTRLMKKAGQDLINGRGDAKAHISKILYYGAVQNFIFSALQSALFALFFDDDEEDDEKRKQNADKKLLRTVNSMVDTILRGSGIYGAVVSTIKNTIQTYYAQEAKEFMADHTYTVLSALNISPPIGSKFRKLYAAIQTRKFEKDAIAARGWALTANGKLNLGPNWAILGALTSGVANVPIDRIEAEISSIAEALDARNKAWQRIALALGWKTWDVGAKNEEEDLIETLAKEKRKEEGKKKAAETRRKKQKSKFDIDDRITE